MKLLSVPLLYLAVAGASAALAAAGAPYRFDTPSNITQAGTLVGTRVETRDGQELGRVHDLAIDLATGRVAYVVVSVGSFLIDDSLIAVTPDALRESADADGRLVLEADADQIRNARRFAAGNWPLAADVLADSDAEASTGEPGAAPDAAPAGTAQRRGSATISDGRKTATLSAGERSIRFEERQPSSAASAPATPVVPDDDPAAPPRKPATPFERLDRNGDGVLDRAEIAHELSRTDSFSGIDANGNGVIDPEEFAELTRSRQQSGR